MGKEGLSQPVFQLLTCKDIISQRSWLSLSLISLLYWNDSEKFPIINIIIINLNTHLSTNMLGNLNLSHIVNGICLSQEKIYPFL
jgi:hypothetical protein